MPKTSRGRWCIRLRRPGGRLAPTPGPRRLSLEQPARRVLLRLNRRARPAHSRRPFRPRRSNAGRRSAAHALAGSGFAVLAFHGSTLALFTVPAVWNELIARRLTYGRSSNRHEHG